MCCKKVLHCFQLWLLILGGNDSVVPSPSLIILGQARGGTTDAFNLIQKHHPLFQLQHEGSYKEFNFARFCSFLDQCCNFTCTADIVQMMLACPGDIVGNQSPPMQYKACRSWVLATKNVKQPCATMDAAPSLFSRFYSGTSILNTFNQQRGSSVWPITLLFVREPVSRIIALYSMWEQTWGKKFFASSLERYLLVEMRALRSSMMKSIVVAATNPGAGTVSNYRKIQYAMKTVLDNTVNTTRQRGSVDFGFLADSLVLPQLAGWLDGGDKVGAVGRTMIIQSEQYFINKEVWYNDHFVPFLKERSGLIESSCSVGPIPGQLRRTGGVKQKAVYAERSRLSSKMKYNLYKFFDPINAAMMRYLFNLQSRGLAYVYPRLKSPNDTWWVYPL